MYLDERKTKQSKGAQGQKDGQQLAPLRRRAACRCRFCKLQPNPTDDGCTAARPRATTYQDTDTDEHASSGALKSAVDTGWT